MYNKKHKSILIISDTHAPYMHKDAVAFLRKVKQVYKPTAVVHIGDEVDGHSWSYHEKSQALPSPNQELELAIKQLQPLYKLFPEVAVIKSNHGSLPERKAKSSNIPSRYLQGYREALDAPKGWDWHPSLILTMSDGYKVKFVHGVGVNVLKVAETLGMSIVQGHYHTKLWAAQRYVMSLDKVVFGLQVGCLVNDKSPAFSYNKDIALRPAMGCGVIIEGIPEPIPMILDSKGNWIRRLV